MVLEKITLQKCLLYFESLHGRPVSPLQLMAPSLARMNEKQLGNNKAVTDL